MDFIQKRFTFLGIGVVLFLFSLWMFFSGLANYGIDMTWGTQSEFTYEWEIDIDAIYQDVRHISEEFNQLNNGVINGINVYGVTGQSQLVVIVGFNTLGDEKQLETLKTEFNTLAQSYFATLSNDFHQSRYINIGKNFWDYIKNTAKITLAFGMFAISIYIVWAFFGVANGINTYSFAGIVLFSMLFDVLGATWFYIFTGVFFHEFQIDILFITSLLTVLWYTINNTIVVFDRIRSNVKIMLKDKKTLHEIINISISETITRSIYTSLTLLFVLITTFLFGPETMRGFILTLIYGVILGTFSSLFIAPTVLYEVNKNAKLKTYEKKVLSDEDKIVV